VAFSSVFAHKNIPRLVEAFANVAPTHSHRLVLVGHARPDLRAVVARFPTLSGRVHFTGFVPDSDVAPLLGGADLLAFPSLYEGFGLPLIDAQALGVAIAASNAGSLPEVGGDGALYFDPASVAEMTAVIRRCLDDVELRRQLIARGYDNAKRFSWARTAERTQRVYEAFASAS
jgi:glycosyltransferase involved in cell wall biosynthesis